MFKLTDFKLFCFSIENWNMQAHHVPLHAVDEDCDLTAQLTQKR